jgi:hypothetical protein
MRTSNLLPSYLIIALLDHPSIHLFSLIPIQKSIGFSDFEVEANSAHNYNIVSRTVNLVLKSIGLTSLHSVGALEQISSHGTVRPTWSSRKATALMTVSCHGDLEESAKKRR